MKRTEVPALPGFGSAALESKEFARAGRYSALPRSDCYRFETEKLRWYSDLGASLPQSSLRDASSPVRWSQEMPSSDEEGACQRQAEGENHVSFDALNLWDQNVDWK